MYFICSVFEQSVGLCVFGKTPVRLIAELNDTGYFAEGEFTLKSVRENKKIPLLGKTENSLFLCKEDKFEIYDSNCENKDKRVRTCQGCGNNICSIDDFYRKL